jgi:hypothetical protein
MQLQATRRTMALAVVLLAVTASVLYAVDPSRQMLTPPCPYRTLTGLACPGCGLTRCVHALLHGEFARAFAYNPWIFAGAPAALVFAALPRVADQPQTLRLRTGIAWTMLAFTLAFWVWRNTDGYPFIRV